MSRREPRASAAGAAQKDALHEFEQFKKKFLLANKHITKLNSSLSTRCQELETLVSTLNSENLRLHATMLSLYAELKREREKTIVAMAALERSTMHALVQTFGNIRRELSIPLPKQKSPASSPPRVVRRPDPGLSPHANRLAQAPNFSQIAEEDEGMEGNVSPTPEPQLHRRRKSGGRSSGSSSSSGPLTSASRVTPTTQPLAPLLPAPQIVTAIHVDIDDALLAPSTRKRIARRQSGLIGTPAPLPSSSHSLTPPRPPSPAFGSPMRRAAGLAEEQEENDLQAQDMPDAEADVEEQLARAAATKKEKRRRLKALAVDAGETEGESGSARERERDRKERDREKERRRSRHEADEQGGATGPLFSLKDVTNTALGPGRNTLTPLEIPLNIQARRYSTPEDSDVPTSAFTTSTRPTLTTPGTTPGPSHLPTPRTSSPPPIPYEEPDQAAGGRERRVRKSVNYAEPKLNTKMRKPDPQPDGQPRRSSAAAPRSSVASRASSSVADDVNVTVKRKRSRPQLPVNEDSEGDGEDDDGAQADEEYMPARDWAGGVTRRRSTQASSSRRAGSGIEERRHSTLI
ncbi:hypothetical protein PENSPDRAFT_744402 [Peniophora sp. CONT]|nr:hypothetical protein PENSPDRAFT_744402 [Peniophora sp. CONT]